MYTKSLALSVCDAGAIASQGIRIDGRISCALCSGFAHLPLSAMDPLMSMMITTSFGPLEAATYLYHLGISVSIELRGTRNLVCVLLYSKNDCFFCSMYCTIPKPIALALTLVPFIRYDASRKLGIVHHRALLKFMRHDSAQRPSDHRRCRKQ